MLMPLTSMYKTFKSPPIKSSSFLQSISISIIRRYKILMGICWSYIGGKSNPAPVADSSPPATAPAEPIPEPDPLPAEPIPEPDPLPAEPIPEPDPLPSSDDHLFDGENSFTGSNVSRTTWFSNMTTNLTTLLAQMSGTIAAVWVNAAEDNELSVEDEGIPDAGTASDSKLRAFTFAQLKAATFNFRKDMMLGQGGFGSVYKGWVKENVPSLGTRKRAIAVKILDAGSKQGYRQWRTEVGFLGKLSHPNIIKLLGYCKENENLLIVYELMQKGSLNYHLFASSPDRLLSWEIRVQVMIGMARGLSYLHMMEKPIIYRDFKSSNILLDQSYTAKISDFGLAKWGPTADNSYVSGHVMGTMGYAAPEYIATGNLYVKSDVYSFGVVLVEMLTGLRAIDRKRPPGQMNLVKWTKPLLSNRMKLREIMDSRLDGRYSAKESLQIALLAVRCLQDVPNIRPSMKEVADTLESIGDRYITGES